MFASNTSNVNEQPDAQFNYVTMLLHGDGTNGAQNNTFLDSSTNNFTITRNGNTTQGTFSPYGSNWSNYFDGNGDEVRFGSASDWTFLSNGLSDWTVEFWIFTQSSSGQAVLDTSNGNGNNTGFFIYLFETGTTFSVDTFPTSGGSNFRLLSTSGALPLNQWTHIAATYNKTTKLRKLYVNGVLNATLDTTGFTFSTSTPAKTLSVSWSTVSLNGNLSNVRIVKDSVVYTSDFTPSTAPLTAITGTQLLTCQSNRFIDNSSNAFAITVNGNPSVQRFSPFAPTAAYSAATIGGSGYFDGTGDYLSVADNSAFTLGSGDFTVEAFVYSGITGAQQVVAGQINSGGSPSALSFSLDVYSSNYPRLVVASGSTTYIATSSTTFPINQWVHLAGVRDGNTLRIYVNGVQTGTQSVSGVTVNDSSNNVGVGRLGEYAGLDWNGYISNFRLVKGTCVYPSGTTFTPPTTPLTAITNTQLLCNFTNAGIIDNAMMNDLETVGNAQISTAQSKFGGGSISLSASGNTLRTQYNNPSLSIGSGDFTIEGWVYFSSTPSTNGVFQMSGTSGGFAPNQTANLALATNSSTTWQIYAKNTFTVSSTTTIPVGSWIHFALVRSGTTTVLYINGSSLITLTSDSTNYSTPYIGLGAIYDATSYPLAGYIDDLRITKGYARYTANFTPPAAAFPTN